MKGAAHVPSVLWVIFRGAAYKGHSVLWLIFIKGEINRRAIIRGWTDLLSPITHQHKELGLFKNKVKGIKSKFIKSKQKSQVR